MSPLALMFIVLTVLFLIAVYAMNIHTRNTPNKEGFQTTEPNKVGIQIRTVLDPMIANQTDICSLFKTIRDTMKKNEIAEFKVSEEEATKRVEKSLNQKIPGGALPCPFFTYPKESATDIEWLSFLQKIPDDFGARVVLMAFYARDSLKKSEDTLKESLTKQGFQNMEICTPDLATTRRAEKKDKTSTCVLPEDVKPETIQNEITKRLETLVATKTSILKANNIDPLTPLDGILKEAKRSQAYLEDARKKAESGDVTKFL